jgi:polysaccharide export outer membrane protein
MTVRQAVALAGGYDIMRFRMNNPFLESADYNAERQSLQAELSREIVRSARLEAELDSAPKIAAAAVMDAGPPSRFLVKTLEDEQDILELREADLKNDRDSYDRSIVKAQEQLKLLGEQRQKEEEGAQADIADYANIQDIFRKGNTSMLRLTDSRRVMLLSSTRLLQTTVQLAQANRDLETLNRNASKLNQLRRAEIHDQLQDSRLRTKQIEARLAAASEKLAYASLVKSQLVRGDGAAPEIKLVRTTADGPKSLSAGEDDALEPGDVVEVSLRSAVTGLVR